MRRNSHSPPVPGQRRSSRCLIQEGSCNSLQGIRKRAVAVVELRCPPALVVSLRPPGKPVWPCYLPARRPQAASAKAPLAPKSVRIVRPRNCFLRQRIQQLCPDRLLLAGCNGYSRRAPALVYRINMNQQPGVTKPEH